MAVSRPTGARRPTTVNGMAVSRPTRVEGTDDGNFMHFWLKKAFSFCAEDDLLLAL
jgi:hypothetical protein